MKNVQLVTLATLLIAGSAFGAGHGVEKMLPADAHNVQIQSADIAQIATGQKLVTDGFEGPVYDNTYTPELYVTVTYDSKDTTDAPQTGTGNDFDFRAGDSTQPTVAFTFALSDAQLAAIKAKTLNAASLVTISVDQETVQIDDPSAQSVCRYDFDSNLPLDGCVEPATAQITVSRPVLHVSLAQ
jgi:hypothetical protein